jgi:hypothetical protein
VAAAGSLGAGTLGALGLGALGLGAAGLGALGLAGAATSSPHANEKRVSTKSVERRIDEEETPIRAILTSPDTLWQAAESLVDDRRSSAKPSAPSPRKSR